MANSAFQFRFEPGRWQDIELPVPNLRHIVAAVTSVVGNRSPSTTFPELYKMIVENHNASKEQDPKIVYVVDWQFEVLSNQDDVLKVGYKFSVLYGTRDQTEIAVKARNLYNRRSEAKKKDVQLFPEHEPRHIEGQFTVMPGN